ncbi:CubicO group peptidase (beta-lactamase class C family) [Pedobacter cryoconitis]|uniref:CubicO group peptidase (Beta-lactamase class C family) n=1 Tax=Pedobacter cryoconitis TaxID=188932 RepID=A0A7W8YV94_9SPHI|nr:serine hydrolase [Pedobacter cryoconitis]MBB5622258.1 CubicO group peptidase (beta-lactamase class C family) [Pedobacter cryoconitis]MBB5647052.1 CubicO group peptidase (beta-lactamase class C family) [Pedobacter cryoconitis]
MKLRIITALLGIVSLNAVAQRPVSKEDSRFNGLDTTFQRVLKTWHAAGFAVAVVQKNKVIYARGFGYRDAEKKLPVTANTLFAIGSCSKAFTTTLIGKLQKEGKVNIDQPVNNYLPGLKFYNEVMTDHITLRDMMSHRTGLSRFDMSWYLFNTSSTDSLLKRIKYMEPNAGLREKWQYNNFMYMAQGALIEKLTGKSWGDNIKEKFFIPLGMTHSNVSIPELLKSEEISTGYGVKPDNTLDKLDYYNIDGMAPAGAINSNVNDMAKWLIAWINNGKYEGKEIIPEDFRNQAISSQAIVEGALPEKGSLDTYFGNYGFGWFLDSYKGHYRVEHGGNIDGFSAISSFFPADSIGVVVLSNQHGSKVPVIVKDIIVDRLLHLKYQDWNSKIKSERDKAELASAKEKKKAIETQHNPSTHALKDFAGSYTHPAYGTMKIYVQNDSLFAKSKIRTYWLRHANYDIFELFDKDPKDGVNITTGYAGFNLQFHMNLSGNIDGFEAQLESKLKPFLFARVEDVKQLKAPE